MRACTISIKRMTQREVDSMRRITLDREMPRPKRRLECVAGVRPCPYIACKYHLYLDVSPRTGSIKLNFPDLEVWELPATCALDIADRGGTTLEDVGAIMNLTRERVRQLEVKALTRLGAVSDMAELRELCGIHDVAHSRTDRQPRGEARDRSAEDDEADELFDTDIGGQQHFDVPGAMRTRELAEVEALFGARSSRRRRFEVESDPSEPDFELVDDLFE